MQEKEPAPENQHKHQDLKKITITSAEEEIFTVEPHAYFSACKKHGVIYKITRRSRFSENGGFTDYALRDTIDGEDFIFRVVKSFGYGAGVYSIDFISEKYSYALMEFNREGIHNLEEVILSFIQTVLVTDQNVKTLKFTGAPSNYSKKDVEDARTLLIQKGHPAKELNSLDPNELRGLLYRCDIQGTELQNADNNYEQKRLDVFTYRLGKLFSKYKLPYSVRKDELTSDVFIERIDI
jgi:hypothetical protein